MRLLRIPEPFDHPDFLFEPKIDGFRSLAYIDGRDCQLVSRNGRVYHVNRSSTGGPKRFGIRPGLVK